MKTRKILVLFAAVFALVALLIPAIIGGGKVGLAQDVSEIKTFTAKNKKICVKVDPVTKCLREPVNCDTTEPLPDGKPLGEILITKSAPVNYVAIPGNPCQSFVFDNGSGNTVYYCTGGVCYPY